MYDTPPAKQRTEPHRRLTGQHYPERDVKRSPGQTLRTEQNRDDLHGFLGIITAMPQRTAGGRYELQPSERGVHDEGRGPGKEPGNDRNQQNRQEQTDGRRQHEFGPRMTTVMLDRGWRKAPLWCQ